MTNEGLEDDQSSIGNMDYACEQGSKATTSMVVDGNEVQ